MTAEQLRDFTVRDPFEPFTIHLNDGSHIKVTAPDDLIVPRQWKWNAIVSLGKDRFTVLYLRNIAHVSSRGPWPKTGRKRRGKNGSEDNGGDD